MLRSLRAGAQDAGLALEEFPHGTLSLVGSPLRLSLNSAEFTDSKAHLHVLATSGASEFDYCLMGLGADRQSATDEAATVLARFGLPPLLAATGSAVPLALPFSGRSRWGVPGRRGYAGVSLVRGSLAGEEPALFDEPPPLPLDSGLHLLKAVVECDERQCSRTLELDGREVQQGHRLRWRLDGGKFGMAVKFAVFGGPDTHDDPEALRAAQAALAEQPSWLFTPAACLSDKLPARFVDFSFDDEACLGGRLLACVEECRAGMPASCYSAALAAQRDDALSLDTDQALFVRACTLGMASGCTNAAAFLLKKDAADPCAGPAFEVVCERGYDPWACTMLAKALLAHADKPDAQRLQRLLAEACRLGDDGEVGHRPPCPG